MNNENKITVKNLIYALLFLVFGIILLNKSEDLVTTASKVIGIILMISGIVKSIIYIYMKGKLGDYSLNELLVGLLVIGCGALLFFSSSALSFAIRVIIGLWVLFAGINKIIFAISMKSFDKIGFRMYLSSALVMLVVGVLLTSGLFDQLVGLFIIIYSISEIVDYIYYISKNKGESLKKEKSPKKKTKAKQIKSKKVVDASIVEDSTSDK